MESILQNSAVVAATIFVLNIVFIAGLYYGKFKHFVTKAEINEMIDDCMDKAEEQSPLKADVGELKDWRDEHLERSVAERNDVALKLSQIDFNVQNICQKLDVKYIGKKNGS